MPSPASSLATLRPDLGGSFLEYDLEMMSQGFIASRVMPVFETMKQSGPFGKIPIEQLLKNRDTLRAPGSGYARSSFTFTTDTFACIEHGAEEPVDDRESTMYTDYFDSEMVAAQIALKDVMLDAEKRVAAMLFNATTWAGAALTTTVANEWDDKANATPIADIEAAVKKVWDGSGMWPNALIINKRVFRNLRNSDEIINLVKYNGFMDQRAGSITEAALAQVFDLDQVIVAGSPKNTATEGQSVAVAPVWSDEYAMLAKVAATSSIKEPCVGRTFHWSEDGSSIGGTFESYREESKRSDIIRVRHDVDEKVLYVQAAHLLSNITT